MNKFKIAGLVFGWGCVGFYDGYQCIRKSYLNQGWREGEYKKKLTTDEQFECAKNGFAISIACIVFFPFFLANKMIDIQKYLENKNEK